jgi:adenylyl-sulfate kinase
MEEAAMAVTDREYVLLASERRNGRLPESSANITWQDGRITRADRRQALGAAGATVWLTGLPASGKSTIGAALEERLVKHGKFAYLLDGDNLRHGICGDLGFSSEDRARNVARAGELAGLFADAGAIAIVALISPSAEAREAVRERHAHCGLPVVEVHVATPLERCVARDPKGLYARCAAGQLTHLTGIDDPYEPPSHPDLRLGDEMSVPAAVEAVAGALERALSGRPVAPGSPTDLRPPRQGEKT